LQVKIYRLEGQVPIQAVVNHDPIALGRVWSLERDWEASNEDGGGMAEARFPSPIGVLHPLSAAA
jgi:hypothetical protein